jgi:hypothetical protein
MDADALAPTACFAFSRRHMVVMVVMVMRGFRRLLGFMVTPVVMAVRLSGRVSDPVVVVMVNVVVGMMVMMVVLSSRLGGACGGRQRQGAHGDHQDSEGARHGAFLTGAPPTGQARPALVPAGPQR